MKIKVWPGVLPLEMDEDTGELEAPCGCSACDDNIQPGHFACSTSPEFLIVAERSGRVFRSYDNGAWRWFAPTNDRLHRLLRAE